MDTTNHHTWELEFLLKIQITPWVNKYCYYAYPPHRLCVNAIFVLIFLESLNFKNMNDFHKGMR